MDEKRLNVRQSKTLKTIFARDSLLQQRIASRENTECCMVPVVQASGHKLVVFYVLKGDKSGAFPINQLLQVPKTKRAARGGQGFYERYYLFNETGNVTTETFEAMAEKSSQIWRSLHPGLEAYLTLDNLGAHRSDRALSFFLGANIRLLFLLKNSTHISQALDGEPFGIPTTSVGKRKRELVHEKLINGERATLSKSEVVLLAMESENTALSLGVIKKAFEDVGLYPFNPEKIISLAEENSGGAQIQPSDEVHDAVFSLVASYFKKRRLVLTPPPEKVKMPSNICITDIDLRTELEQKRNERDQREQLKEERRQEKKRRSEAREEEKRARQKKKEEEVEERQRKRGKWVRDQRKKRIVQNGGSLPRSKDGFWHSHCRGCLAKWLEIKKRKSEWITCEYECGLYSLCISVHAWRSGEET